MRMVYGDHEPLQDTIWSEIGCSADPYAPNRRSSQACNHIFLLSATHMVTVSGRMIVRGQLTMQLEE